ncbi:MAG: hypothetical protein AB7O04_16280 [Hyphomonadaceae bacterium]
MTVSEGQQRVFLALFSSLREALQDDPTKLAILAENDAHFRVVCEKLADIAELISRRTREQKHLFTSNSMPAFVSAWRADEERYQTALNSWIFRHLIADLELLIAESASPQSPAATNKDEHDEKGLRIEQELWFGLEQSDSYESHEAYEYLQIAGLDVRGLVRRREKMKESGLFVFVPAHVSSEAPASQISVIEKLAEAQKTYILGALHASAVMLRSLMEATLVRHYETGKGRALRERIGNCSNLPQALKKTNLIEINNLANDIVHNDRFDFSPLSADQLELDLLRHFKTLRILIERAPK